MSRRLSTSFFLRLFLGYVLLASVLSASIIAATHSLVRKNYIDTLAEDLYHTALVIRPVFEDVCMPPDTAALDSLAGVTGSITGTRVTVMDSSGTVLADTHAEPSTMESHRGRPEIVWALQAGSGSSLRYSTTIEEKLLYVAVPLRSSHHGETGVSAGVLRLSVTLGNIDRVIGALTGRIIQGTLILALVALLAALVFSRKLSRPVRDLASATARMAEGDFDVRVATSSVREMYELGKSFNEMVARTGDLIEQLSTEKKKLGAVMSSISEGMLVVDGSGRISLWNDALVSIVGREPVSGEEFWKLVTDPELADAIRRSLAGDPPCDGLETTLGSKTYLCSMSRIPSSSELVITLHDITEMTEVLRMKKDFIANVSHELRTPLTAIKGFAETLAESSDPESLRYVEIIERNTDRLISLVKDLQVLSELESRSPELVHEEVDLESTVRSTLTIFEERARNKGLEMELWVEAPIPRVMGDAFRLEQVFVNLIDNAVSYTEEGRVSIGLRSDGRWVFVEVSDSGIGIPEEDRQRVFERFYVVDKSRSRQQGGTGLGLAIVKHIVMLHGGYVEMDSEPGTGSTFTVVLPVSHGDRPD